MQRFPLARFLIASILAPLLLACVGTSGPVEKSEADIDLTGPLEVTLWHTQTGPLAKALQDMVDDFNRTNPQKITVKLEFQGTYTQLYQKNLAAIQAGTVPETAVAYESFVADYMKANIVVDLDPYVRSKHGLSDKTLDDIYKPYLDTNRFPQFGNRLLSFPFTKSVAVMYQNDDILKELGMSTPKTWDEFEKAAKAATKKGPDGTPVRRGWAINPDASYFDAAVLALGGRLMSEDSKTVAWAGKEGLQILQIMRRGIDEGWAYVPKGFDWQNDFGQGKLLFSFQSTTSRPFVKQALQSPSTKWSIQSLPQSDPKNARTVMFGANVAVFKSTPEKQLASWEFVKWFTDTAQTARWAVASSYMPVRKSAVEDAALKQSWAGPDPQGKQSFDLIGTSFPEPNVRGQQDIRDVIFEAITKVTTKRATPEEAIKEAEAKANQILKEQQ